MMNENEPESEPEVVATGADADFWSKRYGRPVTRAELFEIEQSLVGLFELMLKKSAPGERK